MAYLQAAVTYVNHFQGYYPAGVEMWRQENPVSYFVEKDGETRFWDGGQCEVVGECTYQEEEEEGERNRQPGWGVITTTAEECEVDEHDLQLALALSEEDPHDLSSVHEQEFPQEEEMARDSSDLTEEDRQVEEVDEQEQEEQEELAKRLRDLNFNPVPHVPRVNADIPPVAASSDKQRLLDRLTYCGLAERKMAGDGNCQFRALSDQLYGAPDHHMSVRMQVVSQLAEAPDSYSSYVPMDYNQYLENMARDGEWGDHVTLQAASDSFGVKICLITSFKESCFIEIIPAQQTFQRGLYLSFWSEIHYNSICPLEETDEHTRRYQALQPDV